MTGQEIRAIRKALGETQGDFGERFGVSGGCVGGWEREKWSPEAQHQAKLQDLREKIAAGWEGAEEPDAAAQAEESRHGPGIPVAAQCAECDAEATDRMPDGTSVCQDHWMDGPGVEGGFPEPGTEEDATDPDSADDVEADNKSDILICCAVGCEAESDWVMDNVYLCPSCAQNVMEGAVGSLHTERIAQKIRTLHTARGMLKREAVEAFLANEDAAAIRLRDLRDSVVSMIKRTAEEIADNPASDEPPF